jgi:cytoskeletal protein CcmA (bactofilin family)
MWGKTMEREGPAYATPPAAANPREERASAPGAGYVAPVAQSSKAGATVGKTMKVMGDLYSDEELYMDGELEGSLEVSHRLTIGPNGKVKANVKARELVVKGWIQGNVEVADRIVIMNGASIVGDVKTAGIVIEDGAFFKGGIDILRPEGKQAEAATPVAIPVAKSQGVGR